VIHENQRRSVWRVGTFFTNFFVLVQIIMKVGLHTVGEYAATNNEMPVIDVPRNVLV
jgi:hypothetical protein